MVEGGGGEADKRMRAGSQATFPGSRGELQVRGHLKDMIRRRDKKEGESRDGRRGL